MTDFAVNEYIVKDKYGKLKVWQQGKLVDYQQWLQERAKQEPKKKDDKSAQVQTTNLVDTGMEEPVLSPPHPALTKNTGTSSIKKYSLEKIIDKIVSKLKLQLNEEERKRLSNIVFPFFRDVRDAVAVRQSLQGEKNNKGLEWSEDQTNQAMVLLKDIKTKIEQEKGQVMSIDLQEKELKKDPKISKNIESIKEQKRKEQAEKAQSIFDHKAQSDEDEIKDVFSKAVSSQTSQPTDLEDRTSDNLSKRRPQFVPASKVAMQEVKRFSKLVGPVDELRRLTLDVFRRLGKTAEERVRKIENRIDNLAGDSVEDKVKIIKAWQSSPVYDNYVSLGKLSLEQGKSVEQVISEQQQEGNEVLTPHEFSAILDLNRKLRY